MVISFKIWQIIIFSSKFSLNSTLIFLDNINMISFIADMSSTRVGVMVVLGDPQDAVPCGVPGVAWLRGGHNRLPGHPNARQHRYL